MTTFFEICANWTVHNTTVVSTIYRYIMINCLLLIPINKFRCCRALTTTIYRICQRNVKITSHNCNQHLLLYITANWLLSNLGRYTEHPKWYILLIIWALKICLIYMLMLSGPWAYISDKSLISMLLLVKITLHY